MVMHVDLNAGMMKPILLIASWKSAFEPIKLAACSIGILDEESIYCMV